MVECIQANIWTIKNTATGSISGLTAINTKATGKKDLDMGKVDLRIKADRADLEYGWMAIVKNGY